MQCLPFTCRHYHTDSDSKYVEREHIRKYIPGM